MIGLLLSVWYIGQKTWKQALFFWLAYLGAVIITGAVLGAMGIPWYISTLAGLIVYALLAYYWYHFKPKEMVIIYLVALGIDLLLVFILVFILMSIIGFDMIMNYFSGTASSTAQQILQMMQ